MLPICLGEATKFSQFLLDSDKRYVVIAKLGERTNTSDSDGEVVETREINVTQEQLERCIASFKGETDQIPSMFSALKYQGKPLYEYARAGIEVPRESRKITVYSIDLLRFDGDEVESYSEHQDKLWKLFESDPQATDAAIETAKKLPGHRIAASSTSTTSVNASVNASPVRDWISLVLRFLLCAWCSDTVTITHSICGKNYARLKHGCLQPCSSARPASSHDEDAGFRCSQVSQIALH